MTTPDWIAIDWGTSHLRAWAMSPAGEVLDRADSECGMSRLERADYEPALLELIGPWLPSVGKKCPVLACGMVGSKQGWIEVPYQTTPCHPAGVAVAAPVASPRVEVLICPGVKQDEPADVMRGEETQIAGLLHAQPEFEGVICLPGTHSKWTHVQGGEIQTFQTFLTGELFGLLASQSVLRHSVGRDGWDEGAFLDALHATITHPESIAAKLFSIRAGSLLLGIGGATARARLSGFLIGSELAATRPLWQGQEVAVIGATELAAIYVTGLEALGAKPRFHPGETMTLAGLLIAYLEWSHRDNPAGQESVELG
jgi:2-dehydro-3-deoxygalactonokinase